MDNHFKKISSVYVEKSFIYENVRRPLQFYKHNIFQKDLYKILLANKHLNKIQDGKMLDVGCGKGLKSRIFFDLGLSPKNYYGIDLSKSRLSIAKSIIADANYLLASADSLPYDDHYFDIVFCASVFSSIHKKKLRKRIYEELLRVLKPNGVIIYWDVIPENNIYKKFKGLWLNIFSNKDSKKNNDKSWIRPIPKNEIIDFMQSNGLNVKKYHSGIRHEITSRILPNFNLIYEFLSSLRIASIANTFFLIISKK